MIDPTLIEDSLERLAERCGDPKDRIYARLFELRPELETLFVMDVDGGVRGAMLQTSLECLLGVARNDGATARHLLEAARLHHAGYGVEDQDVDQFFVVMRDVCRDAIGGDWTPATDAAWTALLEELSNIGQATPK